LKFSKNLISGSAILALTSIMALSVGLTKGTKEASFSSPLPYAFAPRSLSDDYLEGNPRFSLDADGVLVVDYGGLYGGTGKQHNPLFIT
jgi:hypothetical protein